METTILAQTDELVRLATYAAEGDERKFAAAVEAIDWQQYQPAQLIKIIDLALSLELSTLAIKLAQQSLQLFPHNKQVEMAARVLSPPVVHKVDAQPPFTVNSSTEWLQQHASQYRNQWVAIRDGQLLASAASLKELAAATSLDKQTVVTKVL